MNIVYSEWRVQMIACNILYRCFGDITIDRMPDWDLLDMKVSYNDGSDLSFGIILKRSCDNTTQIGEKLTGQLFMVDFTQKMYRLPIILMVVEEQTERAKIGFVVGWRFGKPCIYRNFELRILNEKNANVCLQIIKSMDEVIRVLSADELNVLKRITFSKKLHDKRIQQAEVLYLRKLSTTYRMKQKEIVNEKQRFERLLKGTPEEEYPKDNLDKLILKGIKGKFRNAKMKSKLILFSTDLKELQSYKNVHRLKASLLVSPNLNELPDIALSMLNGMEMLNIVLDVFVDVIFYEKVFDNISFFLNEPLEGWVKKISELNELKKTMESITMFFN